MDKEVLLKKLNPEELARLKLTHELIRKCYLVQKMYDVPGFESMKTAFRTEVDEDLKQLFELEREIVYGIKGPQTPKTPETK